MTPASSTPRDALARRIERDPASPLVTYYDDATGERIELSAISFANWVYKAANLLRDGIGLTPEAHIAVCLPVHWQSFVVLHAAWQLGASTTIVADAPAAPTHVEAIARRAGQDPDLDDVADDVIALALRPMAVPGDEQPSYVTDFDREIRSYADAFSGPPVAADTPALLVGATELSHRALVGRAMDAALPDGRRLSVEFDHPTQSADLAAMADAVLVAIERDRGVVISVGAASAESRDQRRAAERAVRWLHGA